MKRIAAQGVQELRYNDQQRKNIGTPSVIVEGLVTVAILYRNDPKCVLECQLLLLIEWYP